MTDKIKLIVGLANPGAEYANTRHNAGAWYLDLLTRQYQLSWQNENKFFGMTSRAIISGQDIRFLIPTTFMNLSGKAVSAIANFYRIDVEEILVAHDELDVLPGIAKFKRGGGHGGHNGLKDIISKMNNNPNFLRLRIGIGHPGDKNKVSGFVLTKPPSSELTLIEQSLDEAARATDILLSKGLNDAMHRLHTFKAQ
ncbi:aminoacyl-tRNA hydrolase [Thorsellia anophelis]|uniref:Peptidyl-tRNA hydrolase n=1 Tax=Thorsellia anophelis DSM 18579 TaxID=1123402 RepID=A0A1H9YXJ9_9GAMM|nr:aminoacyl-tRNA hydrolase [Thorsellia anophelis]SES73416.1 peptidyl-tRNA hydrolase, PTH1 family [Thorsellia anophelis DSM 18579]